MFLNLCPELGNGLFLNLKKLGGLGRFRGLFLKGLKAVFRNEINCGDCRLTTELWVVKKNFAF